MAEAVRSRWPAFTPSGTILARLGLAPCESQATAVVVPLLIGYQVEDYEPKRSLVIPPHKMLKFYEEVKLRDETYPWQSR